MDSMLTHDDIEDILKLLDSAGQDELKLETSRFRLTVRRDAPSGGWVQESQTLADPDETVLEQAQAAVGPVVTGAVVAASGDFVDVTSPLPGTFYRAPKPGAAPFVEVGDSVKADTVIAIVETMKLMNSTHAGVAGTVAEICVQNGAALDAGQVLMRIKPDAS